MGVKGAGIDWGRGAWLDLLDGINRVAPERRKIDTVAVSAFSKSHTNLELQFQCFAWSHERSLFIWGGCDGCSWDHAVVS